MTFAEAKESRQKVRYHSWWWGRWVQHRGHRWTTDKGAFLQDSELLTPESKKGGWELYDDTKHGVHNDKET